MKKITLLLNVFVLLFMAGNAQTAITSPLNMKDAVPPSSIFSKGNRFTQQQVFSLPEKDHDFYMRRCRTQRIIGLSMLGGGVIATGIGFIVASNDGGLGSSNNENTSNALFITGATLGLGSIPFMILAHASKNKAKLSLSSQKTGFGLPARFSKNITGLTVSINLGK